ncbi:hypothetical protein QTN47_01425 [Danxiaibacter flavus]|uniref:Uncharacterized protein n=1 Tax=Danxiaibacter flavus TaxID=3049108 RepID=A0ABV3Z8F0_9BACT|nr:hypothetical protein QNM32_01425 [Chitinophagaceae bacterium DXS]
MKYEIYRNIKVSEDYCLFEFISDGQNGYIFKRIEFSETAVSNIYNLAFGDVDEDNQINDIHTSNNGDRNKILSTVAFAVDIFLSNYPKRWVYFKGSTQERTRLYRMAISLNLDELSLKFTIYGEQQNKFVPFQKNVTTDGFLIKKKLSNFDI